MSSEADTSNKKPSEYYKEEVRRGAIQHDEPQFDTLLQLDTLYTALTTENKPRVTSSGPLKRLTGMLFRKKPADSETHVSGFYLWGGVGTGKTLLMDLFFDAFPAGFAIRTHFHRFMRSVHIEKNSIRDQVDPLKIIAAGIAQRTRLLCLDEFTVSDITDAMIMSGLLGHLFEQGVVLVTTSNTPIENLYHNGLQRERFLPAIALLEKHTVSVNVDNGNDYRMAFFGESDLFLVPADQGSFNRLSTTFNKLAYAGDSDERRASAKSITINGRDIGVIDCHSGAVWFGFDAICRTNRSNSDFIDIAREFHTVIISGIPELGSSDDDAARRLIELIDELYDRNVNLLVSSDRLPTEIYTGKRLAALFRRTASRLVEMGSREYLAKPHCA